jgi:hypothetical protein
MDGTYIDTKDVRTHGRAVAIAAACAMATLAVACICLLVANLQNAQGQSGQPADAVVVTAHDDSIDLTIRNVGGSGTAQVLRYEANAYHDDDPLKGVVAGGTGGEAVGSYECGTTQVLHAPRKGDDGHDYLYSKYYVVQGGLVLAGPYYATSVDASDAAVTFSTQTKKGGANTHGRTKTSSADTMSDLGCGWTNVTVDLGAVLVKNENADGTLVDTALYNDTTSFTYEGTEYRFSSAGLKKYDDIVKAYTKKKINVQVVLLCYKEHGDWSTYPQALSYVGEEGLPSSGDFWSGECLGYNTATDTGEKYFLAALEFLAQRWSQDEAHGLVHNFVIGNEIDWAFAWQHIASWHADADGRTVYETLPLDTYMEEIARTLRLGNLAVKKYNSNMTVSISFTNQWADSYAKSGNLTEYDYGFDTYAPKDQLDWLFAHETARGDYDWGLSLHPYANNGIAGSDMFYWELKNFSEGGASTDFETSAHLGPLNIEIVETYLEQAKALYNGQVRTVRMTEVGASAEGRSEEELGRQAGYVAWMYYRFALLPCVKSIEYWPLTGYGRSDDSKDQPGLTEKDAKTTRPAYDVWKYIDTNKSFEYADKYLKYLSYEKDGQTYSTDNGAISSYEDLLDVAGGKFDWKSAWHAWGITSRRADL